MVYTGSASGKIKFGVICILLGLSLILAGFISHQTGEKGACSRDILLTGEGFAIAVYGVLLTRNSLKRPGYI